MCRRCASPSHDHRQTRQLALPIGTHPVRATRPAWAAELEATAQTPGLSLARFDPAVTETSIRGAVIGTAVQVALRPAAHVRRMWSVRARTRSRTTSCAAAAAAREPRTGVRGRALETLHGEAIGRPRAARRRMSLDQGARLRPGELLARSPPPRPGALHTVLRRTGSEGGAEAAGGSGGVSSMTTLNDEDFDAGGSAFGTVRVSREVAQPHVTGLAFSALVGVSQARGAATGH